MRIVIGLEIHAQLLTKTKIFCGCSAEYFGAEPNAHTCPVCLGMPGALPVLNEKAVEYALKAALALNCEILSRSKFDRKNYFYPDLPKGYQISQYDEPVAINGCLTLSLADEQIKNIRIRRLHLEEDAGKSIHMPDGKSLVDLNRAGVPLIEIVTEPDLSSAEEARLYMEELRRILRYIGVCSGDLEEGSLRCDANVSVSADGALGTKTEIKNMNSFRAVEEAIKFEVTRQTEILRSGARVVQATLTWNSEQNKTEIMRTKEEAQDYRYFPDPDLVPLEIADSWKKKILAELPELPQAKRVRWKKEFGLPDYDIDILADELPIALYFESAVKAYPKPKEVSNWMLSELLRLLKESQSKELTIAPIDFVSVLKMVESGQINRSTGKEVLEEAFKTGKAPEAIVNEKGLGQISDESKLIEAISQTLIENAKAVSDFKSGKEAVIGFLQGQVMKKTQGKADPKKTRELLIEHLKRA
jgi:aspartyl-tRNA(Asn)/glutamyl-tRNA(Gln) amidotransferase subunit B